jgi:hypothetical protein
MKFYFVGVDVDAATAERDAFTTFLRTSQGVGFWHDVSHVWLIRDGSKKLNCTKLRDKAREMMPTAFAIVVEARPTDYAAFSPETGHEWLNSYVIEK